MKNRLLLLSCSFLFICCGLNQNTTTNLTNEDCESLIIKSQILMNNYFFFDEENNDYSRLDSALSILYSIDGLCPKYNLSNSLGILMILSLKKEYLEGVKFAEHINDSIISATYRSIIINRFKAMNAQFKEDLTAKNERIKTILSDLQHILSQDEINYILLLPTDESFMQYEKAVYAIQYFYYRGQIEGVSKIVKELDSLQINYKDNEGFESILKISMHDDFMVFKGY